MVDLSLRARVPGRPGLAWPARPRQEPAGLLDREPYLPIAPVDVPPLTVSPEARALASLAPQGIRRGGWVFAVGLHAAILASALLGLPLKQTDAWPPGAFTVTLLLEPRPEPAAAPAVDEPVQANTAAEVPTAPPPDPLLAQLPPAPATPDIPVVDVDPPPVVQAEPEPAAAAPDPLLAQLPPMPAEPETPAIDIAPPPPAEAAPRAAAKSEPPSAPLPRPRAKPASPPSTAPGTQMAEPALPEPPAAAVAGSSLPQTAALPIAFVPPRPVSAASGNRTPSYPAEARRRHLEGLVVLKVAVSARGTPDDVAVLKSSGHAVLDAAALAAVRSWRFEPATRSGLAVAAPAEVPVRFRLED
jgi:protein TonB